MISLELHPYFLFTKFVFPLFVTRGFEAIPNVRPIFASTVEASDVMIPLFPELELELYLL